MPDMDPHGAGPSIPTLLTGQDEHRSSLLWDAHLEGKVCTYSIYVVESGKWNGFYVVMKCFKLPKVNGSTFSIR